MGNSILPALHTLEWHVKEKEGRLLSINSPMKFPYLVKIKRNHLNSLRTMYGDTCTGNLFNFQFRSIKRESFHCQINIIESFVCIYLRRKTNSNFGTQPLWDRLVYCSVLLSSVWKFSWHTNFRRSTRPAYVVIAFPPVFAEIDRITSLISPVLKWFYNLLLMSFQFGTHANPLSNCFF